MTALKRHIRYAIYVILHRLRVEQRLDWQHIAAALLADLIYREYNQELDHEEALAFLASGIEIAEIERGLSQGFAKLEEDAH